jgi:tRNA pseudouridine55 synthase
MNGLILIDKPAGCTSHDVVNRWRKIAGTKRAGHLGTLDPMATGLLVLVTGNATRLAQFYGKSEKTYLAEITLGETSDTYDAEGIITTTNVPLPPEETIVAALNEFRGKFLQTPPPVSAKKIKGVPAYKLARQNIEVELKPVEVEVKQLDVRNMTADKLTILVSCTAGTYIRSIAHDLGQRLGCGALLSCLRRTQAGEYSVEQAHTLDQLATFAAGNRLADQALIPIAQMLPNLPAEYFDSVIETHIRQGREFRTSPFVVTPGAPLVKALSRSGDLIAIGELKIPNLYHPGTVF